MSKPFNREEYEYKQYLPTYPKVNYEPNKEVEVVDRALMADPEMKSLLSAATKAKNLTPVIGTKLEGIDLRQLTDQQKDELALLAAQRGVIVLEDQDISIHEMVKLGEYFGPLHVHGIHGVPADPELKAVHIVFADGTKRADWLALNRGSNWHSDQTYEINTPGLTALKIITAPEVGGDTVWCSAAALYSSFSRPFQEYLEKLTALHSCGSQIQHANAQGTHIRRPQADFVHPVVRVHPVTGWKSIFVNNGYTIKINDVPKDESDTVLNWIYHKIEVSHDFQVRIRWKPNQIVMWDNRFVWHTATHDFYPEKRHGLRVTPHGERPRSVEEYERATGKKAKDWYTEKMKSLGVDVDGTEGRKNVHKALGAD